MPGTKEALEIFRKRLEKMNVKKMSVLLRQLQQEKKRRKKKKK